MAPDYQTILDFAAVRNDGSGSGSSDNLNSKHAKLQSNRQQEHIDTHF